MRGAKVEKLRYERGASRVAKLGKCAAEELPLPSEVVLTAALLGISPERAWEALHAIRPPREDAPSHSFEK
jgi:hypothetical protein